MSKSIQDVITTKRLATVKMMPEIYKGAVTESGLRALIFHEYQNGFHDCIRRVGRKVLIDLDDFEVWIDKQKPQKPHATAFTASRWR